MVALGAAAGSHVVVIPSPKLHPASVNSDAAMAAAHAMVEVLFMMTSALLRGVESDRHVDGDTAFGRSRIAARAELGQHTLL